MNEVSKKQKFVILYKYVSYKAFESIMEKWALKASFPFESNDPLEYVAQYTDSKIDGHINNHSPQDEPPPFISFSRKMSDVTMWGQYADFARGVCLVFKFPLSEDSREYWADENADSIPTYIHHSTKADTRNIRLEGVRYSNDRFTLGDIIKEHSGVNPDFMALCWKIFAEPIKASSWQYEDEVRIMEKCENASSESNGMLLYSWPMNYLYGVIVGSNTPFPTEYIKHKIRICYNNTEKNHNFWKNSFDCYVIRASVHPTKFAYEAFPFGDRMETAFLEKTLLNTKDSNHDRKWFWHDKVNKIQNDLSEWRNNLIRNFTQKIIDNQFINPSDINEDEEKVLFVLIDNAVRNPSLCANVFHEEGLTVEDVNSAISDGPEDNCYKLAKRMIDNGLENLIKEVNLGAEFLLDSLIADCFNNIEQETRNKMPSTLEPRGGN